MSVILAPTAKHPAQLEPIFSTRQAETEQFGQTLTVSVYFPNGSHDSETAVLGAYGDWIAGEIASEAEDSCTRKLRRRINAREMEAKDQLAGIYK
jgi:hypothetical protein